ncbi:hypothetical protein JWJ90_13515 [Desulfobulbus rhabdoformis]|jgi:chromosome segregation ATPase|uniref:hypothetical protein n=1 Tax=Desulfobulbus rhabdoformis TaxID=34032 RepID=UPI001964A9B8|nr:hypothetical protein [Desulfobulbus rhabdoformis]MBM9615297.1 hypothetical protein [Desulfobulbus rhabdoformis]
MQDGGDFKTWHAIAAALLGLLSGTAGGAWSARGLLESLRKKDIQLDGRIDATNREIDAANAGIKSNQADIEQVQEDLKEAPREARRDMEDMLDRAIGRIALQRAGEMEEVRTNLAVLTALSQETRAVVRDLSEGQKRLEGIAGAVKELGHHVDSLQALIVPTGKQNEETR